MRLHQDTPGPQCEIHVHQMGGAVARVGQADTAFPERSMPFVLNAVTGTPDAALLDAHTEWARAVVASANADHTGRAYVNFLGDADGAAESAYGEETYARLVALKERYDPTNVFHLNQNIVPSVVDAGSRIRGCASRPRFSAPPTRVHAWTALPG